MLAPASVAVTAIGRRDSGVMLATRASAQGAAAPNNARPKAAAACGTASSGDSKCWITAKMRLPSKAATIPSVTPSEISVDTTPVITDNFILLPQNLNFTAGQTHTIIFREQPKR